MLKLEKVYKTGEINITLREQDRFLTKNLLIALGIAIALHLTGVLLFHVNLFKIVGSQTQLPTIPLDIEIPSFEEGGGALSALDQEDLLYLLMKEPKGMALSFPSVPEIVPYSLSLEGNVADQTRPVVFSQEDIYPIDIFSTREGPSIPTSIIVSGPLSENEFYGESLSIPETKMAGRVFYEVQVENRTGLIFWHEYKEGNNLLKSMGEEIIRKLRFLPNENDFVTRGNIEIVFSGRID